MKRTKLIWIMICTLAQVSCKISNESNSLVPNDSLPNSASPSEVATSLAPTGKASSGQPTKVDAFGQVAEDSLPANPVSTNSASSNSASSNSASSNSASTKSVDNQPASTNSVDTQPASLSAQVQSLSSDGKAQSAVEGYGQQLTSNVAQTSIESNKSMVTAAQSASQVVASSSENSAGRESKNSEIPKVSVIATEEDCRPLKIAGMPQWFDEEKVFLTRVAKPCITASGEPGSEFSSHWVTMGISCSGGENRFRWLENYLDPKQVNLDFGMNCPMSLNWGDVSQALSQKTGLLGSKMIAYNPMAVVYWELEETGEKDTGSLIKIKNVKDLRPFWREFIMKGKPLSLKLVGYESAWTEVRQYFQISAQITKASKNTFKLRIQEAKPLGTKELAVYQSQCEQLVPRRDCDRVF